MDLPRWRWLTQSSYLRGKSLSRCDSDRLKAETKDVPVWVGELVIVSGK